MNAGFQKQKNQQKKLKIAMMMLVAVDMMDLRCSGFMISQCVSNCILSYFISNLMVYGYKTSNFLKAQTEE